MPGPKSKLTSELMDGLTSALAAGTPLKHAAAFVKVSESSVHAWRLRGERYELALDQGGEVDIEEQVYLELAQAMREAQGRAVVGAMTRVREAMNGRGVRIVEGREVAFSDAPDWRAAAWYLVHCHPGEFTSRIELTGADGGALTFQSALDAEIAEVMDLLGPAVAAIEAAPEEPASTRTVGKVDLLG